MSDDIDEFLRSIDLLQAPSLITDAIEEHDGGRPSQTASSTPTVRRATEPAALPRSKKRSRERRGGRGIPVAAAAADAANGPCDGNWSCSMCTLSNDCASTECAACSAPRSDLGTALLCTKCSFVNRAGAPACANCGSHLPRMAMKPSRSEQDVVWARKQPTRSNETEVSISDAADRDGACAADGGEDLTGDADGDSGASEAETMDSSSDSDSDDGISSPRNEEVVNFLRHLDCVKHEHLPFAAVPTTMAAHGELRPFQLQAVHWMLQRENRIRPPEPDCAPLETVAQGPRPHAEGAGACTGPGTRTSASVRAGPMGLGDGRLDGVHSELSDDSGMQVVRGGILADFMGLGKTRTTIALCEATRGRRFDRVHGSRILSPASLIVCPASLLHQWRREILSCVSPQPKVLLFYGEAKRKLTLFQVTQNYDYVITSYQTLCNEMFPESRRSRPATGSPGVSTGVMAMATWQRIILDEAHYIRNMRTLQCQACLQLDGANRWVLTATPIMNHLSDLFSLLVFLRVPHFSCRAWWNNNIVAALNNAADDPRAVAALKLLFSSLLLRRTPSTTSNGQPILVLPQKNISVVRVDLGRDERDFYDAIHKNAAVKLDAIVRRNTNVSAYSTAFEMLVRCRQACLHPYIVVAALQAKKGCTQGEGARGNPMPSAENGADSTVAVSEEIRRFTKDITKKLCTQGHFVNDLLEAVSKQQLGNQECIICLDVMVAPAILPCAHTFCEGCIQHALQVSSCCPLCKRKTKKTDILVVPDTITAAPAAGPALETINVAQEDTWRLSTKIRALLDAIRQIPADEKIIVFSAFVTFLNYVQSALLQEGVSHVMFTGALTAQQKESVLRHFNGADPASLAADGPRVLLATITACGVGLNLTRASHCFLMEPSWNPGIEEQAMNRIHRIGQTRPVHITQFVARDTVEEKINLLGTFKRALSGYCFDDSTAIRGVTNTRRLPKDELLALFHLHDSSEDSDSDDDNFDSESS